MALIIGVALLLPYDSIPLLELPTNLMVLTTSLVIVVLFGILLGEFVHSLANLLENILRWVSKWGNIFNWDLQPPPEADVHERREEQDDDRPRSATPSDQNYLETHRKTRGRIWNPRPSISERVSREEDRTKNTDSVESGLVKNYKGIIHRWMYDKYVNVIYSLFLSHRELFSRKITEEIAPDYQRINLPISGTSFTHQHLIKKSSEEYNIKSEKDAKEVYSVVVSTLSNSDCERAFRFQARYSFCRSMAMVLFFLSVSYILTYKAPSFIIPSSLHYTSYILYLLDQSEIRLISCILIVMSIMFSFASGAYKRYYVEYLISELYVRDKLAEE